MPPVPSPSPRTEPRSAVACALDAAGELQSIWADLCGRDPELHAGIEPPLAQTMVAVLTDAFVRPQPLSRLDQSVRPVVEAFTREVATPEAALAMLACLREAWTIAGVERAPARARVQISERMNLIIDRMLVAATRAVTGRLAAEALVDPLTGLGNRRAFDRDLARSLSSARRHGRPLTMVMIDVDGLKQINDGHGHGAGDEALRDLAQALQQVVRAEDGAYRLGGDEFALLLEDAIVLDGDGLEDRICERGGPSISLGIATAPPDEPGDLMRMADRRLYERRHARRLAGRRA